MTKLSHVLVIEKDRRGTVERKITDAYHALQSGQGWDGLIRAYAPRDDKGVQLPAENRRLQLTVQNVVREIVPDWAAMIDTVATKDVGNMSAKADLTIDGIEIASDLPSTHLLFLEKQLAHVRALITKMPIVEPDREWQRDDTEADGRYKSEAVETIKTKKVPRFLEMSPATDRHPAQVHQWNEDVIEGTWTTVTLSGAIKPVEREALLARVDKALAAVKTARETANIVEAPDQRHGQKLLSYVFGDMLETPTDSRA